MTRTFTTSKGETFASSLTEREAATAIMKAEAVGRLRVGGFGPQLAERVLRGRALSAAQLPWLHKIALEVLAPVAPPAPVAQPATSLLPLVQMLQRGAQTLKRLKVQIEIEGVTIALSIAGARAQHPGTINVTNGGPFGANEWYGRIHTTGRWEPSRRTPPARVLALLERWAENPAAIAAEHGRKTGACAFCRRHLETHESTAVGYGPVCAEKFGLPWGGAAATAAELAAENAALAAVSVEEAA